MVGSDITTIMYVLGVNKSMNTEKFEFLTSMDVNWEASLLEKIKVIVNNRRNTI